MNMLLYRDAEKDIKNLNLSDQNEILTKLHRLRTEDLPFEWLQSRTQVLHFGETRIFLSRINRVRILWVYLPGSESERNIAILGIYPMQDASEMAVRKMADRAIRRLGEFFKPAGASHLQDNDS